ncbi:hypothetical protein [Halorussus marinus]|uniref:hypothetical protein n=1 Tax=Halorussus marinus TaxID=2505976 RepID=UPI00143D018E|nr:hypothetical protein [Halorussus marinus]
MFEQLSEIWKNYGPSALVGGIGGSVLGGLQVFDPVLSMAASDGRFWIAVGSLASSQLPAQVPSLSDRAGTIILIAIVGTVLVGKVYQRYGPSDS